MGAAVAAAGGMQAEMLAGTRKGLQQGRAARSAGTRRAGGGDKKESAVGFRQRKGDGSVAARSLLAPSASVLICAARYQAVWRCTVGARATASARASAASTWRPTSPRRLTLRLLRMRRGLFVWWWCGGSEGDGFAMG